ncbi:HlyD family efflux transporter periplasmic adaptor subunit [Neolewinella aurantiaca]|uniref:HlyD family efflux transporter periplasmic adaptor subunit n=1 Tax=Neolewinella aurantiaca TaxID=2602767 RepID=A0A5C7FKP4_9BACT|nr:efflux RND transporter periplasmic adaptor subunit [Neolewinella aurantiaca]TXF90523.1 HlyD family efflux transporter periplasmic adaptor subunit [Neolewinella aurantiaca]
MSKRNIPRTILSIVIGLAVLAIGWFGLQYMSGLKQDPPKKEIPKRIKTVEATTVNNSLVTTDLTVQGRLEAYNKIELFSEVGGAVTTSKPFKKGTYFGKGDVMLRVDDTEARLNIQAQKATLLNGIAAIMPDLKIDYPESFPAWEEYLKNFDIDSPIKAMPEPANQREKLFIAGRNLQSQYYTIKSQEERLSKYTLYAPFSGVLTTASINNGAVIRTGQVLGELMATGYYEMLATVPLSQLNFLKPGGEVKLYSEDIEGEWTGKVKRISDQIDPQTQTVGVYVGVTGKDLREGMYLRGEAAAKALSDVVEIERDLLIDDSSVYAIQNDTLLVLLPVTVRKFNRETVIVSGLPDGTQLLTSDVAGAYDGMRVKLKSAVSK